MNWYKKAQQIISLTPAQVQWVEWALDPMYDLWCTEEGEWDRGDDGMGIINEEFLPKLQGNILTFNNTPIPVIEDLLYRLEDQAGDVSETDANSEQQIAARYRSSENVANKIRKELGL